MNKQTQTQENICYYHHCQWIKVYYCKVSTTPLFQLKQITRDTTFSNMAGPVELGVQGCKQCTTKTRFWYLELKPRSNFGIGIGAETLISETETFIFKKILKNLNFCHVFQLLGVMQIFYKLEKQSRNDQYLATNLILGAL